MPSPGSSVPSLARSVLKGKAKHPAPDKSVSANDHESVCGSNPMRAKSTGKGFGVLIVEPDDDARRVLAAMVKASGRKVWATFNTTDALRILSTASVQVIVIDVMVPIIDGLGKALLLKERQPDLEVIVLAGGGAASATELERAMAVLEGSVILNKPVVATELYLALTSLELKRKGPK